MRPVWRQVCRDIVLGVGALVMCVLVVRPAGAGMRQSAPSFSSDGYPAPSPRAGILGKGASVGEAAGKMVGGGAMPDMAGGAMRPGGPMAHMEAQATRPPAPVTRERTAISLAMVARYGDAEDAELRRYEATFDGSYEIRNKKNEKVIVQVFLPYPDGVDTIPDAQVLVDGKEPADAEFTQGGVNWKMQWGPRQVRTIRMKYRAYGTEDFAFPLDHDQRMKELAFAVTVTGTERKPVLPARVCLEPTTPLARDGDSFRAEWKYTNLITTRDIMIEIPPRLLGGNVMERFPSLARTALIVVPLLVIVLAVGGAASMRPVGAAQLALIALAAVMFYPLLLYISQHISAFWSFIIAFVAVSALVLSSVRRYQGARFAFTHGLFALVVILGLFSAASLTTRGAGTLVAVGTLMLVGYIMRTAPEIAAARAHMRPTPPRPSPPPAPEPGPEGESPSETGTLKVGEGALSALDAPGTCLAPAEPQRAPEPEPEPKSYCAFCGAQVQPVFHYCPNCGESAHVTVHCAVCGRPTCAECRPRYQYCQGCGSALATGAEP